jgi:hypothetical protein
MLLEPNEEFDRIIFREAVDQRLAVLVNPANDAVRHANIERAIGLTCQDIDVIASHARIVASHWSGAS